MFSTTIIPTIGRPTLARAVRSVLEQEFPADQFEVVVVNDSADPLSRTEWLDDARVRTLATRQRERSVARNTGASIARGRYLHFLDDDDWLLPGALERFRQLAGEAPDAGWLYAGSQLVDRQGQQIIELHPDLPGNGFLQVLSGEWLPLQASLIKADAFFELGGFNPLIPANEDVDLSRRFTLRWELAGADATVACISMGEENSTTDYGRASRYGRQTREAVLDEPGAYRRMRSSAHDGFWHGRIVRAYLTSSVWNLAHRRPFTAASRLLHGLAGLLASGSHALAADFWAAVLRPYESRAFLDGFERANRRVRRRTASQRASGVG